MFKTIFSWFTSDNKNVETVTEGIVDGVDKIFYMDEEKAEHSLQRMDANNKAMDLFVEYQRATQPQNVARRKMALIVVILWAVFVAVAGVGVIFDADFSTRIVDFIKGVINWPFITIISFYFLKRMGDIGQNVKGMLGIKPK